uniref:1,3-beta-glucanosyltransferase n=1 Tax=Blastobotrys adeninivorans TaxID=409370 RepID=A0A060T471_BLAAD
MSMLAASGIYLILDVNSPKIGESLNRWEPWTTYTPEYLHHIFKVVHQFSAYNNTLAFFAGNEIVNDDRSASNSPHYIKAVIRDIKSYISNHAPRPIPVGYSAADDLRYRISLADFLACGDNLTTVDFYGVNSYQWCGDQTFTSSGYDTLVNNYKNYPLPIFLSEFGCNVVLPRKFQEIEALYGPEMTSVFSGGLVYEYSQEPNNYGLVEINPNGDVYILKDFETLSSQFKAVQNVAGAPEKRVQRSQSCEELYPNINSRETIPDSMAVSLIEQGLQIPTGKFVDISMNSTTHRIFDSTEKLIENKTLVFKFRSSPKKSSAGDKKSGKSPKLRGLGAKNTTTTEDKGDDDSNNESGAISLQFMWTAMAIAISMVCLHQLA